VLAVDAYSDRYAVRTLRTRCPTSDTRNDVLRRDLRAVVVRAGTRGWRYCGRTPAPVLRPSHPGSR
jgi:hypothetical protein